MGEKQQYEEITVELVELQTFSEYVLRRLKCTKADSQVSSSLKGTLWSGVYTSGNRQVAVERGLCEAEFIQAATARLQLKTLKVVAKRASASGNQRQRADPARSISSATGER